MSERAGRAWCVILALAATAVLILPASAAATVRGTDVRYVDVGFDPDDRPVDQGSCCQQDPDIRSTRRKVWVDTHDRRWLSVAFRSYEPLLAYWTVIVRLDTRAGPRVDARMAIFDPGTSPPGCWVRFRSMGPRREGGYHAPVFGDRATCRVPLRWVHPDKQIRWKLFSPAGLEGTEAGVDEYAPNDRGWYA